MSARAKCDLRAEKPRWEYLASSQSYLRRLLREERLDEIWRLGRDEWESQQLIVAWLKRQFCHSHPYPHPPADARIMLHWIRSGRSGIYCAMFVSLSVQLFAALGVPARYVRVFSNWRHQARGNHGTMEVWSRQFGKWVILDPDLNVWYTRDGTPLGITELSRALWARTGADIRPVTTPVTYGVELGHPFPIRPLPLFRHATVLVDFPKLVRDQTETNMIVHRMHYLVWVPCPAARKAMETIRASLAAEAAGYTDDIYNLCDDTTVFDAPPDPRFLRSDPVHRRRPDFCFRPLDVIEKHYAKSCDRAKPCRTFVQRYIRRIGTPRPSGQIVWTGDRFVLLMNSGKWGDRSVLIPSGSEWRSYSPDGRRIQQGVLPAGAFCDMAISNDTMWLLDSVRLSVVRWPFNATGAGPKAKPSIVWTGSPDRRPVGIATVAGDLWIAGISKLGASWLKTPNGRSISLRPGLTVSRVAPAGADRMLLVDAAARTVWLVCPDTGKLRAVRLPRVCVLSDAAMLPDGRLAVTDLLAGRVLFVRQDGTITGSVRLGKTARPWFCAWGGGRLAVADYSTASLWFMRALDKKFVVKMSLT